VANRLRALGFRRQLWSAFGKKRATTGKKADPPAHEDRVLRVIKADQPNRLWLWEITEQPRPRARSTCARSQIVYSNRIVGYSISDRMSSRIAANALASAVARRREVAGCIVPSASAPDNATADPHNAKTPGQRTLTGSFRTTKAVLSGTTHLWVVPETR
jgi:transposase InsO family protein